MFCSAKIYYNFLLNKNTAFHTPDLKPRSSARIHQNANLKNHISDIIILIFKILDRFI